MVIVVGGMIGLGKSTVAKILGEAFGTKVMYEKVEGNKILPLFYEASDEEKQAKRYPILLQLEFLASRYESIKEALSDDNNVLDRSIYEDSYFCQKNMELGDITPLEREVYENMVRVMMEELDGLPKKSPDLMVYLKGSFEKVLERINIRGRSYELDPKLIEYYRFLWEGYDEWVHNSYKASQIMEIDMDHMDVTNEDDAIKLVEMVREKLKEVRE